MRNLTKELLETKIWLTTESLKNNNCPTVENVLKQRLEKLNNLNKLSKRAN